MLRPPLSLASLRIGIGLMLVMGLMAAGGVPGATPVAAAEPTASTRLIIRFTGQPTLCGGDMGVLATRRAAFEATLRERLPGAVVERAYDTTFAGAAVRVPGDPARAARELTALPDVAEVYADIAYEPALQASAPAIGAEALWPLLGGREDAGDGVAIAVLDSGIDPTHPMFDPAGWSYPAGFPKGDTRYTTAKVIAARLYVRPDDPPMAGESTPAPGAAGSPHGTAVAAAAAGNVVTATLWQRDVGVSGIAPGAWLMNYRVFYPDATGSELAYTAEVLQAIEDAVTDGADVLLLAWSSPHYVHPLRSPVAQALETAMDAGIVVVASAGNVGPEEASATRLPGGIPRVLTAGAVTKGERLVRNRLEITAPTPVPTTLQNQPYEPTLFGSVITDTWPAKPLVHVKSVSVNGSPYACSPLPANALDGAVALVQRGDCYVADKVFYAQQAGAEAVMIANTDESTPAFACAGTHCAAGTITIPSLTVAESTGDALTAWTMLFPATGKVVLDGAGRFETMEAGVVWGKSARGPAYGLASKPDLVAPGVAVLTAGHVAGSEPWLQATGTSLAAAQAAGAAALLLAAHPTWGHDAVKAALVGTADPAGLTNDAGAPATIHDRGAGHLRVDLAAASPALAAPAALSLPRGQPGKIYTRVLTLTNVTTAPLTLTPSAEVTAALTIDLPDSVALPVGGSQVVTVTLAVAADARGDLWGRIVWGTAPDYSAIQVPVWVYAEPPLAEASVLVIDNDFSNFDGHRDYVDTFLGPALSAAGWTYDVWRADERCGTDILRTTLPDLDTLAGYPMIIWMTGDNPHPNGYYAVTTPLTAADQQLLAAYLEGGGRLLALGQNLAQASDVNPDPDLTYGRSELYHGYLGGHWIQGSLFGSDQPPSEAAAVGGMPGTFMAGVALDLGPLGDGEGNQTSIDEIAPGGDPSGSDDDRVTCIAGVVGGEPEAGGCVGVAKAEEPALEHAAPTLAYRSAYLSFGFEGINDREGATSRAELIGLLLDWLSDEVTVTVPEQIGAPWDVTTITCAPHSSAGTSFTRFRWRIGEGEGARVLTSSGPSVAVILEEEGWHPVTVEVCDALGHCGLGSGAVQIIAGGNSTLTVSRDQVTRGQELTYEVIVRNTAMAPATVTVTLPLPDHTVYQAHTTGQWDGAELRWSGDLAPGEEICLTLVVRVADDAPTGATVSATAGFELVTGAYARSVQTLIVSPMYLPLAARND